MKCPTSQSVKPQQPLEESDLNARPQPVERMERKEVAPGVQFGRLTVLHYKGRVGRNKYHWECRCACGKTHSCGASELRTERTRSCGCLNVERTRERFTTHNHTHSITYGSWESMRQRCLNKNHKHYQNYGGRGIVICERWESFANFLEDMGERPSRKFTLERTDNKKGYEPENCIWATRKVQQNNTRACVVVEFNGRQMTLAQWSEELGITNTALYHRHQRGWSIERMLTQPLQIK